MIQDELMWIAVAGSLYGNYLIIKKNPNGYIVWIITNMSWVFYDYWKGIMHQSLLFVIYTIFALYGYYMWTKKSIRND